LLIVGALLCLLVFGFLFSFAKCKALVLIFVVSEKLFVSKSNKIEEMLRAVCRTKTFF